MGLVGRNISISARPLPRTHLLQPRGGALELEGEVAARVEALGLGLGEHHQSGARLIQGVNQQGQPACRLALVGRQTRQASRNTVPNRSAMAR